MIKKYTLVRIGETGFDLLEKTSCTSIKSLETGIIYNTPFDLEDYITNKMGLTILVSSDNMVEISERMKEYDTKGIQYSFTKYLR